MVGRDEAVSRPRKHSEYIVRHLNRAAEKGWLDLVATARNAAAEAWDFLTKTPAAEGVSCYRLKGDLAVVRVDGTDLPRWQLKPTGGGRIWYVVLPATKTAPNTVLIERVTTGHPNETVKRHR
ncbi:MAG: hypothetical protein LBI99_02880 [Propionibacteriaceae bacterium]|jgi:hypothetical protein|nr:hypothetical protein [Propionibacteriaceae bacterium]